VTRVENELRRAFVVQIWHNVEQGLLAARLVNDGLQGQTALAWLGISSLLSASANISKIVWPSDKVTREAVAEHCGLDRSSPLADRSLRNHFEHLDERIDKWWKRSTTKSMIDTMIGPRSAVSGMGDPLDWFRTFDPETSVATFNAEEHDLQALVVELERIAPRCSPPWFGDPPLPVFGED
jgi:hypothetical protein